MAHLLSKFEKDRINGFLVINGKPRFFGQKKTNFKTQFSNFWKIGKIFGRCQKMVNFMPNIAP